MSRACRAGAASTIPARTPAPREREFLLAAIRAFAKSPYAAVLNGLLIICYAEFGAHDMFRAKVGTDVITAGSRSVSPADFKKEFDGYKSQVEQRVGQPISPELAAANGLDRQVLQGVATREAFAALLTKIGLRPSDRQIAEEIQKIRPSSIR